MCNEGRGCKGLSAARGVSVQCAGGGRSSHLSLTVRRGHSTNDLAEAGMLCIQTLTTGSEAQE